MINVTVSIIFSSVIFIAKLQNRIIQFIMSATLLYVLYLFFFYLL